MEEVPIILDQKFIVGAFKRDLDIHCCGFESIFFLSGYVFGIKFVSEYGSESGLLIKNI